MLALSGSIQMVRGNTMFEPSDAMATQLAPPLVERNPFSPLGPITTTARRLGLVFEVAMWKGKLPLMPVVPSGVQVTPKSVVLLKTLALIVNAVFPVGSPRPATTGA